jgi:hypothetical protein
MNLRYSLTLFAFVLTLGLSAQNRKGTEYSGTKARYSFLSKSKMFSEGVKPLEYSVYWNKKKNEVSVLAGAKEKWYLIELTGVDTIMGHVTYVGRLAGTANETDPEKIAKSRCEVRFLMDKISIKIGEGKLEEFLLDGAIVWDDKKIATVK